jgi:hypothetical protein
MGLVCRLGVMPEDASLTTIMTSSLVESVPSVAVSRKV